MTQQSTTQDQSPPPTDDYLLLRNEFIRIFGLPPVFQWSADPSQSQPEKITQINDEIEKITREIHKLTARKERLVNILQSQEAWDTAFLAWLEAARRKTSGKQTTLDID